MLVMCRERHVGGDKDDDEYKRWRASGYSKQRDSSLLNRPDDGYSHERQNTIETMRHAC